MSERREQRVSYMAICCSVTLILCAGGLALLFSITNSWLRERVLATVALYVFAALLFEYGNSGKMSLHVSAERSVTANILRWLAGISGVALSLLAVGFCLALGPGRLQISTVGFAFGVCTASLLLIRVAATGRWFPESVKKIKTDVSLDHFPHSS